MTPSDSALPEYLLYWGKARPSADTGPRWHPLAYHSLDVALAAGALLDARPAFASTGAGLLRLSPDATRRLAVGFIALHDIGKVAASFQSKAPEHARVDPARASGHVHHPHHTVAGLHLWDRLLVEQVGPRLVEDHADSLAPLSVAVFGHHGRPLDPSSVHGSLRSYFSEREQREAGELAAALLETVLPSPVSFAHHPTDRQLREASWWLAGLTNLADWVASNEEWFSYEAPIHSLAQYADLARERAERAVRAAGLVVTPSAPLMSFPQLTTKAAGQLVPTPAQEWAATVPLPSDGPVLVILEDVTGSGKTEAAQMLVHRLMAAGRAVGAYWAMPTQATANAMYGRQVSVLSRLFRTDGNAPSLVLAHGAARLDPRFRASVLGARALPPADQSDGDDGGGVTCAEWIGHDSRRALLADLGAGTVDQALLSILPARFNALRLTGLANKVVILDEVHAYDAYVLRELEELLRFLALLDASVVLLSATLPLAMRRRLADAWSGARSAAGGAAGGGGHEAIHHAYPAAAIAGKTTPFMPQAIAAAEGSKRSVKLAWLRSPDETLDLLAARVAEGHAVAWVRNTVRECMEAAAAARARGLAPIVFHARLAACDRQEIEARVLARVGPVDARDRARSLVIATQVIEQSLDLDFDTLVSDLAPVDLLLQRAGRLWRHPWRARPAGAERIFALHAPSNRLSDPKGWLGALGGTARVYRPSILWRSAAVLEPRPVLMVPEDVRHLVESVYDEHLGEEIPEALARAAAEADGKHHSGGSLAAQMVVHLAEGYSGAQQAYRNEGRVPTRIGDPVTTLRLARRAGDGTVVPWAPDASRAEWERWALSEVTVRRSQLPLDAYPVGMDPGSVELLRTQWGRFDQDCVLVPLEQTAAGYAATLMSRATGRQYVVQYDASDGLLVHRGGR